MHDAQKVRFWLAATAITIANIAIWVSSRSISHAGANFVRVTEASNAWEFEHTGRLFIHFDRSVYDPAHIDETLVIPPFAIEPPIEGEWIVRSETDLVFEPKNPLPPGHTYRVVKVDGHAFFDDLAIDIASLPALDVRPLRLERCHLASSKSIEGSEGNTTREVTFELRFNQPVALADLRKHLVVHVAGSVVAPLPLTFETSDVHSFTVLGGVRAAIGVKIDAALRGDGGSLGLGHTHTDAFTIPSGLHLSYVDTTRSSYWNEKPHITLHFDRDLEPAQRPPSISITPSPGPFTTSIYRRRLSIDANFEVDTTYTFALDLPLIARDGTVLEKSLTRTIVIPRGRPRLGFAQRTGRLGTHGAFEVDLKVRNVSEATLTVRRLLEEHLPVYLTGVMDHADVAKLSEELLTTTLNLTDMQSSKSAPVVIDLDAFMNRTPGVYRLDIEAKGHRWEYDHMLLFVGDLGLELNQDQTGVLAWVTDVETAQPVAGAAVRAWTTNHTILAEGVTDANGIVRLKTLDGACNLVTATLDDQLIFANPKHATGIDDRALAGPAWNPGLSVSLYADRGVHRPGETIRLSGAVRDDFGQTVGGLPLEVRLAQPDKRVIYTAPIESSLGQGLFQLDLPTHDDAPTGHWRVSVHVPGDDVAIADLECSVMPFMPVRLAVEASSNETRDVVSVSSTYLHGAPAKGLPVAFGIRLKPVRYTDPRYEGFRFEDPATSESVRFSLKATLDTEGAYVYNVERPKPHATWRGTAEATVFEIGGRPTTAVAPIALDTSLLHLGTNLRGGSLYQTDESITFTTVLLDENGEPTIDVPIVGEVFSIDHSWTLAKLPNDRREWRSTETATPVQDLQPLFVLNDHATWSCDLPPLPEGTYRFTTRLLASSQPSTAVPPRVNHTFHVSANGSKGRIAADRPDRLELIVEHAIVEPGMESSVLVRAAFEGLALITVETNRVHSSIVTHLTGDGVRVPFTVPDSARDTCFVAATLLRPLDPTQTSWLPPRARGAARLRVDQSKHVLDVAVQASDGARPGERVHVSLSVPACERSEGSTLPPASVHLWAVDEGALLVTDFHAPLVAASFFKDRRRVVASVGTTTMLLPDFKRPVTTQRIGGDRGSRYREPVPNRQPDVAVLWRTSTALPESGLLDLELTMPEINGAMRIMAVVVDGDRYGATEHVIGVVPPLELVAALPQAAAPGDSMQIPVTIRNNTASPIDLKMHVEVDGTHLASSIKSDPLHLDPHEDATRIVTLEALAPGSSAVHIVATPLADSGTNEGMTFTRHIAVRPPFGRERSVFRVSVPAHTTAPIDRDRSLEALAGHVDVLIGGNPALDLKPPLEQLIRYPYGCGEQTGSRIEGLLAALDLPREITGVDRVVIEDMVNVGIDRLWRMQRLDGMIPYWKGGKGSEWLTLRTARLAQNAAAAGHMLPGQFLPKMMTHVERIARNPSSNNHGLAPALACRVLARQHTPDTALMATLASRVKTLPMASRIHLADAFIATGEHAQADAIIATFAPPATRTSTQKGWFTSGVHDAALALEVLAAYAPEHPTLVEYARFINASRRSARWNSTFENAAAITALTKWYALQPSTGTAGGSLSIAGHTIEFSSNDLVRHTFDVPSGGSTQKDLLQNIGDGPANVIVVTSGIPLVNVDQPPIDAVMQITRTWRDANGKVIPRGTAIEAGDLITVDLEVRSTNGVTYSNVAIVDALPGGMEFELPTLATSAGKKETSLSEVDHVEFRFDRLIAFATVTPATRRLRYLLRAIVPGSWSVPAPDALAMYTPDAHARGWSSRVEILLP
jgi:uncharacterized protein YfaS (alpha-2-macroglobulin family)